VQSTYATEYRVGSTPATPNVKRIERIGKARKFATKLVIIVPPPDTRCQLATDWVNEMAKRRIE